MNKILFIVPLLIFVVGGCELLSSNPFILDIRASPEQVSQNEQFKIFVTIKNPAPIEFKPVIMLKFDRKTFSYQNYYYSDNQKIALEPVPSGQQKTYLLQFTVEQNAKTGLSPIGVFLLGEEEAKQALSYKEKQIDIVSRVQR